MQNAPSDPPDLPDAFGLGAQATTLAMRLFERGTAGLGIDGARVFRSFLETGSLKAALQVSDATIHALYARAHRHFALGQIDKSEEVFRALCALDGSQCDYWLGLGICLRMRSQDSAALAAFETSARLAPENPIPHVHILETQIRRENWDAAVVAYRSFLTHRTGVEPDGVLANFATFERVLELRGHV